MGRRWCWSRFTGTKSKGVIPSVSTWKSEYYKDPPELLKRYQKGSLLRFAEAHYGETIDDLKSLKRDDLICALSDEIVGDDSARVPRVSAAHNTNTSGTHGCCSVPLVALVILVVAVGATALLGAERAERPGHSASSECLGSAASSSAPLYQALREASRYPSSDPPKSVALFNVPLGGARAVALEAANRRYPTPECIRSRLVLDGQRLTEAQLVARLQRMPDSVIVFDWTTAGATEPSGHSLSILKRVLDNRCALEGCAHTPRDAALLIIAATGSREDFMAHKAGSDVVARTTHKRV